VLCGKDPASGFASIGDKWYCHGDGDEEPTCYTRGQRFNAYFAGAPRETFRELLKAWEDDDERLAFANEAASRADRYRHALNEVHEHYCGCNQPGDRARCTARPTATFKVLRP
jgi:hypothetical protein